MASTRADAAQVFDDLVRCETRLYNALNDALRRDHGIGAGQFEFLRFLRDHPGSRVGDLAASFAVGVGATSKSVDRLERDGWVRRVRDARDGRSSLLEVTSAGRTLLDAAERTYLARTQDLLGHLDPTQLTAVASALTHLRAALEADRTGSPAG